MLVSSFCLINLLFFGMKIGYGTGALSLSSLSSPGVFFDMDVQPTREYLAWYVLTCVFATSTLIYRTSCSFFLTFQA